MDIVIVVFVSYDSSPVDVKAPPGIKVSLLNTTNILIQGIDKQQVLLFTFIFDIIVWRSVRTTLKYT